MPLSQWLQLGLLALMWGSAYAMVAIALRELPPLTVVLGRVGIAALVLALVVWMMRLPWPRGPGGWMPFAVMGILNNVIPFIALAYGQLEIASGLASVIIATTPLWTVLLSRMFPPHEPIGVLRFAGLMLGIAGVGVLFGPEMLAGRPSTLAGMALALVAAISYGFSGLWGMRLRAVPPIMSSASQLICSTVMLTPIVLLLDTPWRLPMPTTGVWLAVVFLAVVSTALSYIVFYRVLAVSGGTNAMLVTLMMPPLSVMLGIVLLGEEFVLRYVLGAVIIGAALLTIDGRIPRALWRLR